MAITDKNKSTIERLKELKTLYEAGILTKEEMEAEKAEILGTNKNDAQKPSTVEVKPKSKNADKGTTVLHDKTTKQPNAISKFFHSKTSIVVICLLVVIITIASFACIKSCGEQQTENYIAVSDTTACDTVVIDTVTYDNDTVAPTNAEQTNCEQLDTAITDVENGGTKINGYTLENFSGKIYSGSGNGGGTGINMTISFMANNECVCVSDWYYGPDTEMEKSKGIYYVSNGYVVVKCQRPDDGYDMNFKFKIAEKGRVLYFDNSDRSSGGSIGNDFMTLEYVKEN